MNKYIAILILCLIFAISVNAQATITPEPVPESTEEAKTEFLQCEGAQEWYDQASGTLRGMVSASLFYFVQPPSSLQLQDDFSTFRRAMEEIALLEYPECVEWARDRLLQGYDNYLRGVELIDAGSTSGEEVLAIGLGILMIGNADGYLTALGVQTHTAPPLE